MRRYRHESLLPPGLAIEHVEIGAAEIGAIAHSRSATASCPLCGRVTKQVHSRYERGLADLRAHGRRVRIRLVVRRFRCSESSCPRKIFAERFEEEITQPFARRTTRLESIVHHLGLALGGRPGQSLARRLLFPVSKDTLLRVVRSRAPDWRSAPQIVGIDDEAHRSQYDFIDGYARHMRDALPHASFIGFTGTPIELQDANTRAVFGDYRRYGYPPDKQEKATETVLEQAALLSAEWAA